MSIRWRGVDHHGNWLEIDGERCDGHLDDPCIVVDCYHLHASVLPEFVAALYEAAGLPAPVILERPETVAQVIVMPGARFAVAGNAVEAVPFLQAAPKAEMLSPAAIRDIAAGLACLAEVAGSGPDPAEVTELTKVLWDAMKGGPAESAARAALRWFRDKQQRGDEWHG